MAAQDDVLSKGEEEVWVQLVTKVPKDLHRELKLLGIRIDLSMQVLIVQALADKLARDAGVQPKLSGSYAAEPSGVRKAPVEVRLRKKSKALSKVTKPRVESKGPKAAAAKRLDSITTSGAPKAPVEVGPRKKGKAPSKATKPREESKGPKAVAAKLLDSLSSSTT